jgi:hypothetical protein
MTRCSDTYDPVPPSLVCSKCQGSHHPRASGESDCDIVRLGFRSFLLVEGIDFETVPRPVGRPYASFPKDLRFFRYGSELMEKLSLTIFLRD